MTDTTQRDPAFVAKYGPWVLVSGASEGTGAQFSLQTAAKGCNVILVARRVDKLEELATKIRETYGVEVATHSLDLSTDGAAGALEDFTKGKDVGLIVFNAGGDSLRRPPRRLPGLCAHHYLRSAGARAAGSLCQRLPAHCRSGRAGEAGRRGRHPRMGPGLVWRAGRLGGV